MRDTRSAAMVGLDRVIDDAVQVLASSDVLMLRYPDSIMKEGRESGREYPISVAGVGLGVFKAVTDGTSCSVWVERSNDDECRFRLDGVEPGKPLGGDDMRSLIDDVMRVATDMMPADMPAVDLQAVVHRYAAVVENEGYDVEEVHVLPDGAEAGFAVRQDGMAVGQVTFTVRGGVYSFAFEPSPALEGRVRPVHAVGLDPARDRDRIVNEKSNGATTRLLDGLQSASDEINASVFAKKANEETQKVVLTESVARTIAGLVDRLTLLDPDGVDPEELTEVLDLLESSPHADVLDLDGTRATLDFLELCRVAPRTEAPRP
jgi:hypothetical protein